jgi:hypothetical protein
MTMYTFAVEGRGELMDEEPSRAAAQDKRLVKEAVRESLDELAVAYTNGAVKFSNALADNWASMIDAFDNFFLANLIQDRPQVGRTVLNARLSSAKRARNNLDAKIRELEEQVRALGD